MKKSVKITLIIIGATVGVALLSGGIFGFSNYLKQKKCEHEYEAQKTVEATCTEDGYVALECTKCGKDKKDRIVATGHNPELVEAKAATCTEPGHTDGTKCIDCGEIINGVDILPARGHLPEIVKGKEATCLTDGISDGSVCKRCDAVLEEQKEIPALGHKLENIPAVEATCEKPGYTAGVICLNCGTLYTAPDEIPQLEHVDADGNDYCDHCEAKLNEESAASE